MKLLNTNKPLFIISSLKRNIKGYWNINTECATWHEYYVYVRENSRSQMIKIMCPKCCREWRLTI